jgi:septum formation protein
LRVRLILASASPRRAELLRAAGYTFDVVVTDVDESIRPGESPSIYVRRLAADKSAAAHALVRAQSSVVFGSGLPAGSGSDLSVGSESDLPVVSGFSRTGGGPPNVGHDRGSEGPPERGHDQPVVLGADTTVVVDGQILGKPRDDEDGRAMLRRLSGRAHQVMTGVSLRQGAFEVGRVETSSVVFRPLTDEDISWYVGSGEGRDKAGGYAIQGLASRFIPSISGSYSNIVGLPVTAVDELMRSLLASGR